MLMAMSDVSITVECGRMKVTVHGITSGADKENLRNLFERALKAVYNDEQNEEPGIK